MGPTRARRRTHALEPGLDHGQAVANRFLACYQAANGRAVEDQPYWDLVSLFDLLLADGDEPGDIDPDDLRVLEDYAATALSSHAGPPPAREFGPQSSRSPRSSLRCAAAAAAGRSSARRWRGASRSTRGSGAAQLELPLSVEPLVLRMPRAGRSPPTLVPTIPAWHRESDWFRPSRRPR